MATLILMSDGQLPYILTCNIYISAIPLKSELEAFAFHMLQIKCYVKFQICFTMAKKQQTVSEFTLTEYWSKFDDFIS